MPQFYFLSIALNALAGSILFFGDNAKFEIGAKFSSENATFRLVLGVLSAITGFFKLLTPMEGDVPIIGDLFPALTCFFCGLILIFEHYSNRSFMDSADSENPKQISKLLIGNKKIIGAAAVIAAVLHFIFPKVLLL